MSIPRKVAVLGLDGVGKSSIISRFIQNQFPCEIDSTAENCFEKTIINKMVNILDTSSQNGSAIFMNTPIDEITFIIIVFAKNDRSTFESIDKFLTDIENRKPKGKIDIIVCGNKSDLKYEDQVSDLEAMNYCRKNNLYYYATSAKENNCINDVFWFAIRMLPSISKIFFKLYFNEIFLSNLNKYIYVISKKILFNEVSTTIFIKFQNIFLSNSNRYLMIF